MPSGSVPRNGPSAGEAAANSAAAPRPATSGAKRRDSRVWLAGVRVFTTVVRVFTTYMPRHAIGKRAGRHGTWTIAMASSALRPSRAASSATALRFSFARPTADDETAAA
eukprot:6760694-Prymnesium_polylepis.2